MNWIKKISVAATLLSMGCSAMATSVLTVDVTENTFTVSGIPAVRENVHVIITNAPGFTATNLIFSVIDDGTAYARGSSFVASGSSYTGAVSFNTVALTNFFEPFADQVKRNFTVTLWDSGSSSLIFNDKLAIQNNPYYSGMPVAGEITNQIWAAVLVLQGQTSTWDQASTDATSWTNFYATDWVSWTNAYIPPPVTNLNDCADVFSVGTPTDGHVLTYVAGVGWSNKVATAAGDLKADGTVPWTADENGGGQDSTNWGTVVATSFDGTATNATYLGGVIAASWATDTEVTSATNDNYVAITNWVIGEEYLVAASTNTVLISATNLSYITMTNWTLATFPTDAELAAATNAIKTDATNAAIQVALAADITETNAVITILDAATNTVTAAYLAADIAETTTVTAAYIAADTYLSNAVIIEVTNGYITADTVVTTGYTNAIAILSNACVILTEDNTISGSNTHSGVLNVTGGLFTNGVALALGGSGSGNPVDARAVTNVINMATYGLTNASLLQGITGSVQVLSMFGTNAAGISTNGTGTAVDQLVTESFVNGRYIAITNGYITADTAATNGAVTTANAYTDSEITTLSNAAAILGEDNMFAGWIQFSGEYPLVKTTNDYGYITFGGPTATRVYQSAGASQPNRDAIWDLLDPANTSSQYIVKIGGTNAFRIDNSANAHVDGYIEAGDATGGVPIKDALNGTNGVYWTNNGTNYWILFQP